jgi:hypothetical protein
MWNTKTIFRHLELKKRELFLKSNKEDKQQLCLFKMYGTYYLTISLKREIKTRYRIAQNDSLKEKFAKIFTATYTQTMQTYKRKQAIP